MLKLISKAHLNTGNITGFFITYLTVSIFSCLSLWRDLMIFNYSLMMAT